MNFSESNWGKIGPICHFEPPMTTEITNSLNVSSLQPCIFGMFGASGLSFMDHMWQIDFFHIFWGYKIYMKMY